MQHEASDRHYEQLEILTVATKRDHNMASLEAIAIEAMNRGAWIDTDWIMANYTDLTRALARGRITKLIENITGKYTIKTRNHTIRNAERRQVKVTAIKIQLTGRETCEKNHKKIVSLLAKKVSARNISKQIGIGEKYLGYYLRDEGLYQDGRVRNEFREKLMARVDEFETMWREGITPHHLAKHFDVNKFGVAKFAEEQGFDPQDEDRYVPDLIKFALGRKDFEKNRISCASFA